MNIDELLKFVYGLAEDHEPDGWPAIQLQEITPLADEIERLRKDNKALRAYIASLMSTMPKIKADAIRDAADYLGAYPSTSQADYVVLIKYADKIERGGE